MQIFLLYNVLVISSALSEQQLSEFFGEYRCFQVTSTTENPWIPPKRLMLRSLQYDTQHVSRIMMLI